MALREAHGRTDPRPRPGKSLIRGGVISPLVICMDEKEMQALIKPITTSRLKEEIKKRNLKPGRCPTKMDLARMLPEETLRDLAGT